MCRTSIIPLIFNALSNASATSGLFAPPVTTARYHFDLAVKYRAEAESAERALADYARHEQTLRDNGIPSHSHAVVMICDLRRALAEALEIMRRIDADFSGPRVTVHDGNAFSHFQELNRQAVAIRTAARDFITAQKKEKGK